MMVRMARAVWRGEVWERGRVAQPLIVAITTQWVPRSSRTLRRAGTTNAYPMGFVHSGQKLRRQHRYPPLQETQGWSTLTGK